jgi:hypothetical protein
VAKIKTLLNNALAPLGVKIARAGADSHNWMDTANFIPFEATMNAARQARLSVSDYVDTVMNKSPGSSQQTLDNMASLGVFSRPTRVIVEIGPGTGRYLEKTLKYGNPSRYEIYETAGPWATYLSKTYNLILQRTDGYSLADTADAGVDLVHAHKVFSSVPFMVTCCYWHEMVRVVGPGGWVAFDAVTERCLNNDAMRIWARSGIRNGAYPAVVPRQVALSFFESSGFVLAGSFIVPMRPGTTELLVFKKLR